MTLLSTVLMRIRADGDINARRVAMMKSVLIRNLKMEAPWRLDPANTNKGYVLGRLFAVYEEAQRAALGGINATIKDKSAGAASASPQKVFRTLSGCGCRQPLRQAAQDQPWPGGQSGTS